MEMTHKSGKNSAVKGYFGGLFFWVVMFLDFSAMWGCFWTDVVSGMFSVPLTSLKCLGDFSIFFIWYFLTRPSRRWIYVVMLWLIGIFYVVNAVYLRAYRDLMPVQSLLLFNNFGGDLAASVLGLWRVKDFVYLAVPSLTTILWAYGRHMRGFRESLPKKKAWMAVGLGLAVFVLSQVGYLHTSSKNYTEMCGESLSLKESLERKHSLAFSHSCAYLYNGLPVYALLNAVDLFTPQRISLSPEEEQSIALRLKDKKGWRRFPANQTKNNLIFIVVESLNSWVVDWSVDGDMVMPVLNEMVHSGHGVVALDVVSEVAAGASSDGQLIYNTGLLPLRTTATVQYFSENVYPSLASMLGKKESFEIICENACMWNHDKTTKSWGFTSLYDRDSLVSSGFDPEVIGKDAAVFGFAEKKFAAARPPFFAFITTLSMHTPFRDEAIGDMHMVEDDGESALVNSYFQMCRYFDSCIGKFLDWLKASGMYDDSLVVIASDHSQNVYPGGFPEERKDRIVFVCPNTGVDEPIERTVRQIDIFPTVLQLMGNDGHGWKGFGRSLIDAEMNGDSEAVGWETEVSELIIRSDYFKDHPL